jgi:hypothetical protein
MKTARAVLSAAAILAALSVLGPPSAGAATPGWMLSMSAQPSNFAPGKTSEYVVQATNVGAKATSGTSSLEVTLPKAWKIVAYGAEIKDPVVGTKPACIAATPVLSCETSEPIRPGRVILVKVRLEVPLVGEPKATLQASALVKGGSGGEVKAVVPTPVQSEPVPPGVLPDFAVPTTDEDANAATLAGSHPYQMTSSFGFPTKNPGDGLTNDGHPRNFSLELPRGLVGSPAATPVLCTEVELISRACPDDSQLGVVTITTVVGEVGNPEGVRSPLYNMVAPPGSPAEFATDVAGIGVFVHILPDIRSDSDYGIEASIRDAIAFGQEPIFTALTQLWGQPTAEVHNTIRGECLLSDGICPPERLSDVPLLTMPADCPGHPMPFGLIGDTWEEPAPPFALYEASYGSADLTGTPTSVQGCGELEFEPTLKARPTTDLTDSPTGLDFELEQTQGSAARSSAPLRDLSLTLPAGLTVNPSQASGLDACSEGQIGFNGEDEEGALHFSKDPQGCPDAAKIGTAEVTSPLLVARNEAHEVEVDPEEGKPVLEPLRGALYIAKPFENPFGSLVALYLVIEDERTGVVAKLTGEGELDPHTGQITTSFEENPELPLAEVKAHLFGGDRGTLTTPPTCGTYTTESELVPWSAPEGQAAFPKDSFQTTAAPGGGSCPTTEGAMPHAPSLFAGTASPAAGKYSPLVIRLSRADGSQRWQRLEATLPTGLSAKLAGVGECSEADIADAHLREEPQKGAAEQANPSCPASSRIGTAIAAAGSGPSPYYTTGNVYLAGPYRGAPLSAVTIAPAVAGPFDLGTVVVRSALYLDPVTAQVRIVSDPFPAILDGVPVDLRKVSIATDRPGFSLNPTSCNEKSFAGSVTSTLGAVAPISERFQVGGCKSLPYKPKFSAHLFGPIHRGGHPRFRAVLTAKPGEANTAAFSFTLPRSEFIDQGHFRTICTRVQFAASQCPAGSIYGYVKAKSPLVDYTLEGPVYLRSSSHKLPDAVAALRGPPSQPIEIDAIARIDSVGGRLRSRVETVPDAPIEKVIVSLQGGKKGLFQNSTNICKGKHPLSTSFEGQNGRAHDTETPLVAQCKGKGGKKGKGRYRHH